MMSQSQMVEIQKRIEDAATSPEQLRADAAVLFAETLRLNMHVSQFTSQVSEKLTALEADMLILEAENARVKNVCESTYFERDACIGLISKMATLMKIPVGIVQNRVVIDLPSGQVSWDFLESEAHLFDRLPQYAHSLREQTVQDLYAKVMNPGFDQSTPPLSL
jgi:hypothetical protein